MQENEGNPPGSSVGAANVKEEYRDKRAALRGANDEFKYQEHQRYAFALLRCSTCIHICFPPHRITRRQQKQNQDELLARINEETRRKLVEGGAGGSGSQAAGRKVSDIVAYRSPADIPPLPSLQVIVDQRNECVLVPIYGVQVPFHILTIKNASNNQDGDKAYIRINFNVGTGFEPSTRFPNAIFIKELSFRTMDLKHATKVVQEIKSLRAAVMSREKERAERASLVQQDKLVRSKSRVYSLSDLWIRPNIAVGGCGGLLCVWLWLCGCVCAHVLPGRWVSLGVPVRTQAWHTRRNIPAHIITSH